MPFSATLIQIPAMAVPFSHLLMILVQLSLLGGVLMFFRPLLLGIVRALLLVVRRRPVRTDLAPATKLTASS